MDGSRLEGSGSCPSAHESYEGALVNFNENNAGDETVVDSPEINKRKITESAHRADEGALVIHRRINAEDKSNVVSSERSQGRITASAHNADEGALVIRADNSQENPFGRDAHDINHDPAPLDGARKELPSSNVEIIARPRSLSQDDQDGLSERSIKSTLSSPEISQLDDSQDDNNQPRNTHTVIQESKAAAPQSKISRVKKQKALPEPLGAGTYSKRSRFRHEPSSSSISSADQDRSRGSERLLEWLES